MPRPQETAKVVKSATGKQYVLTRMTLGQLAPYTGVHYYTGMESAVRAVEGGELDHYYLPVKAKAPGHFEAYFYRQGQMCTECILIGLQATVDAEVSRPEWGELSP